MSCCPVCLYCDLLPIDLMSWSSERDRGRLRNASCQKYTPNPLSLCHYQCRVPAVSTERQTHYEEHCALHPTPPTRLLSWSDATDLCATHPELLAHFITHPSDLSRQYQPSSFTLIPVGGPLALDAVFENPGMLLDVFQGQSLFRIQYEQLSAMVSPVQI